MFVKILSNENTTVCNWDQRCRNLQAVKRLQSISPVVSTSGRFQPTSVTLDQPATISHLLGRQLRALRLDLAIAVRDPGTVELIRFLDPGKN